MQKPKNGLGQKISVWVLLPIWIVILLCFLGVFLYMFNYSRMSQQAGTVYQIDRPSVSITSFEMFTQSIAFPLSANTLAQAIVTDYLGETIFVTNSNEVYLLAGWPQGYVDKFEDIHCGPVGCVPFLFEATPRSSQGEAVIQITGHLNTQLNTITIGFEFYPSLRIDESVDTVQRVELVAQIQPLD